MNVFELAAKIGLDTSDYDKKLKETGKETASFGDKLKKGLGTAAKVGAVAVAAVGTAAVAVGKTIVDGASKVAAYGDNIDKMSQKMGISAQAYQEWDAILQHSGSSIDGMQRGMMTLTSSVTNATEAQKKAWKRLSTNVATAAEEMNAEERFAYVIKALQGVENETERTALAQTLLGGAAKELGPLLNTSAEDTEKMRQAVHDLGGVMSDEAVKAAAAYQDSLQDMTTAFGGLKNKLFASFMPGITKVMDGLTEIFSGNGKKGLGLISEGMKNVGAIIKNGLPKVTKAATEIIKVIGSVILDNLPVIIEAGTQILTTLIIGIVEALPQLVSMIPVIISTIWKALKENAPQLKEAGLELLKMILVGMQDALAFGLGVIANLVEKIWNKVKSATTKKWSEIKSAISKKWNEIKENTAAKVESIKASIAEKWDAVKQKTQAVWDGIKSAVSTTIGNMKSNIASAWDNIKSTVSSKVDAVKQAIVSKFESARDAVKGIVDKIKGFFNFTTSTPTIKLPHFSISPPGWSLDDLLKGVIPTLSIEWYRKAYDNPYMFTKPTVVSGFGDGPGGEMVYGHDNLMRDIQNAVGNNNEVGKIVELLEAILHYGLKVDIDKRQLYRAVSQENYKRVTAGAVGLG